MTGLKLPQLIKIARWLLAIAFIVLLAAYFFDTAGILTSGRRPYYPLVSIVIAFVFIGRFAQPIELSGEFKSRPAKSKREVMILATFFIILAITMAAFFIFWPKTY